MLSIIIVNYNCSSGLEKTLLFIRKKLYQYIECNQLEIVVIDGESIDSSSSIIERFSDLISFSIIEKDLGIYDAMNKGIYHSKGSYCYFLNTNDTFNSNLMPSILDYIKSDNIHLICFGVNLCDKDGNHIRTLKPKNINLNDFKETMPVCHQCAIFKRTHNLYYDSSYKIIADKDLVYRYVLNYKESIKYDESILMDYISDGFSVRNIKSWKFENIIFYMKYFQLDFKLLYYVMSYLKSKVF